ncbi:alpha/beta hydrolase [Blastococcus saxobsidens]|uniref:Serine aminopeptidase S33 domain-containing protein n=1 Tax=Blastococcus saxobsidens (strain DD2) TaxID=1146883 RepID=H6RLM5_BLASD|nr:alpha/beta hydrolase [Blastococcus saxobsidens]CCG03751.1 protein of unknown function [Blastococcus saxobsidens DD2]
MDTRTLLLGDWTPVVRDGIDVLRLVVLGAAAWYALSGDAGAAAVLAVMGGVTLLARAVDLPRVHDLSVTVGMALQGFGEVWGLYDRFVRFDDLVHVTLPMLTAPVVYIALARLDVVPDPRDETHRQVDAYVADPRCGFGLSAADNEQMFVSARQLADRERLGGVRPDLPVYVAVGDEDPVTGQLALVHGLVQRLQAAGLSDVTLKVYEGARHEVFNETNRAEVVADLLRWLDRVVPAG